MYCFPLAQVGEPWMKCTGLQARSANRSKLALSRATSAADTDSSRSDSVLTQAREHLHQVPDTFENSTCGTEPISASDPHIEETEKASKRPDLDSQPLQTSASLNGCSLQTILASAEPFFQQELVFDSKRERFEPAPLTGMATVPEQMVNESADARR